MEKRINIGVEAGEDTYKEFLKRRSFRTANKILLMYGVTDTERITGVTNYLEDIFDALYRENLLIKKTMPEIISAFDESVSIHVMRKLEGYELKKGS